MKNRRKTRDDSCIRITNHTIVKQDPEPPYNTMENFQINYVVGKPLY